MFYKVSCCFFGQLPAGKMPVVMYVLTNIINTSETWLVEDEWRRGSDCSRVIGVKKF